MLLVFKFFLFVMVLPNIMWEKTLFSWSSTHAKVWKTVLDLFYSRGSILLEERCRIRLSGASVSLWNSCGNSSRDELWSEAAGRVQPRERDSSTPPRGLAEALILSEPNNEAKGITKALSHDRRVAGKQINYAEDTGLMCEHASKK